MGFPSRTVNATVGVIYVLLAAAAVIAIDLRIVLIPTACVSLALAIGGMAVFLRFRAGLTISWPAFPDSEVEPILVIDATPLPFQGYEQELVVVIEVRHLPELVAGLAMAGATLYLLAVSQLLGMRYSSPQIGPFEAEVICIVGAMVLLLNLRWFGERLFLKRSRCAVGTILGRDPGFVRPAVSYQFLDCAGERRGGQGPSSQSGKDNAVLVFYDPKNPDTNASQTGFLLHRFRFGLIPRRDRRSEHQGGERDVPTA